MLAMIINQYVPKINAILFCTKAYPSRWPWKAQWLGRRKTFDPGHDLRTLKIDRGSFNFRWPTFPADCWPAPPLNLSCTLAVLDFRWRNYCFVFRYNFSLLTFVSHGTVLWPLRKERCTNGQRTWGQRRQGKSTNVDYHYYYFGLLRRTWCNH